jgi:hypothetical protein
VGFVEGPRSRVLLEDPEPEARGTQLLDALEQRRADPNALMLRQDVEVIEHVVRDGGEARDLSVELRDPYIAVRNHHFADEPAVLLGCVEIRQRRHRSAHSHAENGRQGIGLVGVGLPEEHGS